MYIVRKVFNLYMYMIGFSYIIDPSTNLRVWIRYNKCSKSLDQLPLVFIHGFGFGIMPYIFKIKRLSVNRTLIVPEFPNISYDLYKFPPPPADKIVLSLHDILLKIGSKFDMIGHSYGALILNIFLSKYKDMCNYKTHAETPAFYIQQSHSGNVVYTKPSPIDILRYTVYLAIYSDMYVQYIFKRSVFAEHGMVNKNLDNKTTIILSKDDYLVSSYHIHKYLTKYYPEVKVEIIDGDHGSYIFD